MIDFNELEMVFRRWLNATRTISENMAKFLTLAFGVVCGVSLMMAESTFGGGVKQPGATSNKYWQ